MPIPFPDFHPRVNAVAQAQYNSGFYSDALFRASRELENECKKILKEKTGRTLSGQDLMAKLFSIDKNGNTIFPLVNLSLEEGADRQKSLYFLYSGFTGIIRNPLAHDGDLADIEALYGLNIVSYLFYKLDQAKELYNVKIEEKIKPVTKEKVKLSEFLSTYDLGSITRMLLSDDRISNIPKIVQDKSNAKFEIEKETKEILLNLIPTIGNDAYDIFSSNPGKQELDTLILNTLYDSKS